MQNSSFFKIITILFAAITMPVMAMEITSTEKTQFIVELYLYDVTPESTGLSRNESLDPFDKHACTVLGIPWEDGNNNKYRTKFACLRNVNDDAKNYWPWNNSHPIFLPLSKIPNPLYFKDLQYTVMFPSTLPTSFVEELKQEKTITLTNTLFEKQVDITLQLRSIEETPKVTLNEAVQCINDFIKEKQEELNAQQETTTSKTQTPETKLETPIQSIVGNTIEKLQEKLENITNRPKQPTTEVITDTTTSNTNNISTKKSPKESPFTTTEIPEFIVTLDLCEVTREDMEKSTHKCFDERDKHACNVLGIKWEDNNNTYWTDHALLKKANDTTDFCCWTNAHPQGIPLSTLANPSYTELSDYEVKFPASLPASFVEQLEILKTITLTNTQFATPVKITIKLGSIKKLPTHTLFKFGCTISIIGFIVWLLHYNNTIDLSHITNFISNLTKK